jgi:hypothetical protein
MALTKTQRTILNRGARKGAKRSELIAAMETSLVESGGGNPNYGDRDSVGWRQERSHYGSVAERMNVKRSADRFFNELRGTRGKKMSPGQKAQAVQRSAFPGRYDERRAEAKRLVEQWRRGGGGGGGRDLTTTRRGVTASRTAGVSYASERQALRRKLLTGGKITTEDLLGYAEEKKALKDIPGSTRRQGTVRRRTVREQRGRGGGKGKGKGVGKGGVREVFYDPLGTYYDEGKVVRGAIGGHSDHVHVSTASSKRAVELGKMAQRMGLHVGEHPKFGGVDPVHTSGSYHYSNRAIDVSGDPAKMRKFAKAVRRRT